jgi:lysozyme
MSNFTYSEAGLAFTRRFEGLRLTAYPDAAGVWTIGYGHTGPGVHEGLTITEHQAEVFLECDIARAAAGVNRLVTAPIAQNQFDALVDFAFNLGVAALSSSVLLRHLNSGEFASAADEFLKWDHSKGRIISGLLLRREAEADLFSQPPLNQPPTSPAQPSRAR